MTEQDVVFLFDVDNTLVDNDRVQDDLRNHLERESGAENRDRYWAYSNNQLRRLGYVQTIRRSRLGHEHSAFDNVGIPGGLFANRPGSRQSSTFAVDGDPVGWRCRLPASGKFSVPIVGSRRGPDLIHKGADAG